MSTVRFIHEQHGVKIAVIEEQIAALRVQQQAHFEGQQKRFDTLEAKLDALSAIINRGRGAYAALALFAATLGALATLGVRMVSLLR